ncbi:MAG: helix-turn-helix transcriptional regulator [Clostridia bacterium]|nr:helix-turn-helix transcriptional regulator [Clostridia bacterium]
MENNIIQGIKLLRKRKKLSQATMGRALGVSRSKISSWELGRRELSVKDAVRVANYFNVSLDYLVDPSDL